MNKSDIAYAIKVVEYLLSKGRGVIVPENELKKNIGIKKMVLNWLVWRNVILYQSKDLDGNYSYLYNSKAERAGVLLELRTLLVTAEQTNLIKKQAEITKKQNIILIVSVFVAIVAVVVTLFFSLGANKINERQTELMNNQTEISKMQTLILNSSSSPLDPTLKIAYSGLDATSNEREKDVWTSDLEKKNNHIYFCINNYGTLPADNVKIFINEEWLTRNQEAVQEIPPRFQTCVNVSFVRYCLTNNSSCVPLGSRNLNVTITCEKCSEKEGNFYYPIKIWDNSKISNSTD